MSLPVPQFAVRQLQADYDRLLDKHNAAVAAGDAMDEALGQLITQARAHRIPEHPVTDSAERALKTWRSAR